MYRKTRFDDSSSVAVGAVAVAGSILLRAGHANTRPRCTPPINDHRHHPVGRSKSVAVSQKDPLLITRGRVNTSKFDIFTFFFCFHTHYRYDPESYRTFFSTPSRMIALGCPPVRSADHYRSIGTWIIRRVEFFGISNTSPRTRKKKNPAASQGYTMTACCLSYIFRFRKRLASAYYWSIYTYIGTRHMFLW